MNDIFETIKTQLTAATKKRIVFPEFSDERVLRAANRLATENVITPIYIGDAEEVESYAKQFNIKLTKYEAINSSTFEQRESLAQSYVNRRKGKINLETALDHLNDANYFATMLVHDNYADGLVSGAIYTTSSAVLPALRIIKPKETMKKVSGSYLLIREDERYIFADCAVNISPSSEELAEITLQSAETAELLQIEPKVAMLSFSTKGSAYSPETAKIIDAVQLVKKSRPSLIVDGEVQFDAAYMPELAAKKAPNLTINGDANVFVFPNLEAGNISCKIAERLGGFQAIGPLIQGLSKPVNLLSRGCNENDVYKVALFTAMQATVAGD